MPMTDAHAIDACVIAAVSDGAAAAPIGWQDAVELFSAERCYWVATTGSRDSPHLRPVLAVCLGDRIYSTTNIKAAKARNLLDRPVASLAARAPAMDIVIEGHVSWPENRGLLERVGNAFHDKYQWPVTVTPDGAFEAPYGAPTAGPGPYRVYEISPCVAYAFGTDNNLGERSTKYTFSP